MGKFSIYQLSAALSAACLLTIAGTQVSTLLKKSNNAEDQLAKTMVEIKNARKDALAEVKSIRSDVLKELNTIRKNSLNELKTDRTNALVEVKAARKEALRMINKAGGSEEVKVWLVLKYGGTGYSYNFALNSIPMKDIDTCQLMGAQWISSPRAFDGRYNFEKMAFVCLEE